MEEAKNCSRCAHSGNMKKKIVADVQTRRKSLIGTEIQMDLKIFLGTEFHNKCETLKIELKIRKMLGSKN